MANAGNHGIFSIYMLKTTSILPKTNDLRLPFRQCGCVLPTALRYLHAHPHELFLACWAVAVTALRVTASDGDAQGDLIDVSSDYELGVALRHLKIEPNGIFHIIVSLY